MKLSKKIKILFWACCVASLVQVGLLAVAVIAGPWYFTLWMALMLLVTVTSTISSRKSQRSSERAEALIERLEAPWEE